VPTPGLAPARQSFDLMMGGGHSSLRHTFGTECAARRLPVPVPVIKELMGHASVATPCATSDQLDAAILQAFAQRLRGGRKLRTPEAGGGFGGLEVVL
jgi:hypothetical protein